MLVAVAVMYRPLLFASVDPEVAAARGVPVRLAGMVFLFVLALTVTEAAQIVGTLLVLSLAITPAAAAHRASAPADRSRGAVGAVRGRGRGWRGADEPGAAGRAAERVRDRVQLRDLPGGPAAGQPTAGVAANVNRLMADCSDVKQTK